MNDIISRLSQEGLLDTESSVQVRDALASGKSLDEALRTPKSASEDKILRLLAEEFGIPFVDLEKDADKYVPTKELLAKLPARILIDHRLMPLSESPDGVLVVTSKVFDTSGLDELRLATGLEILPALAPSSEIDRFAKKYLGVGADTLQSLGVGGNEDDIKVLDDQQREDDMDLTDAAEDASIIRFVNQVLGEALERRATDVHIEPFEEQLRVRSIVSTACSSKPTFRRK